MTIREIEEQGWEELQDAEGVGRAGSEEATWSLKRESVFVRVCSRCVDGHALTLGSVLGSREVVMYRHSKLALLVLVALLIEHSSTWRPGVRGQKEIKVCLSYMPTQQSTLQGQSCKERETLRGRNEKCSMRQDE